jgi:hypothetical protein
MKKILTNTLITSLIIFLSACDSSSPNQVVLIEDQIRVENYTVQSQGGESFLTPDGKSKFEWVLKITDTTGRPLSGVPIRFYVMPINPSPIWRDVDELAKKFESTAQKFKDQVRNGTIKLIGTVNPITSITDINGEVKTTYTTSNIGSNSEESGKELLVASYGNFTVEKIVNLSYKDLVPVPTIEGGLRISEATGKYVHKSVADTLVALAKKVINLEWKYPLTVTAANLRWGGLYPPHFTHRTGFELDLRPMSIDGKPTWCDTNGKFYPNYDREKMTELVKMLKATGAKEMYFNDPKLYEFGTKPLSGHHHHIHVSWDTIPTNGLGQILKYQN